MAKEIIEGIDPLTAGVTTYGEDVKGNKITRSAGSASDMPSVNAFKASAPKNRTKADQLKVAKARLKK